MGETMGNFRVIMEDLKTSWYFRIWGVLWLICGIMVLVALGVLGGRSQSAKKESTQRIWVENATELGFPAFQFLFTGTEQEKILNVFCEHSGMMMTTSSCGGGQSTDKCVMVNTEGVTAKNTGDTMAIYRSIFCLINTTLPVNPGNKDLIMAVKFDGPNYGPASFSFVEVAPNGDAWILVEQIMIKENGKEQGGWERNLVYHSTISQPGKYAISVIINSFRVLHIENFTWFSGWMATGDVGGFAYFLLILHTTIMIFVGLACVNDSKFLKGDATAAKYDNL